MSSSMHDERMLESRKEESSTGTTRQVRVWKGKREHVRVREREGLGNEKLDGVRDGHL